MFLSRFFGGAWRDDDMWNAELERMAAHFGDVFTELREARKSAAAGANQNGGDDDEAVAICLGDTWYNHLKQTIPGLKVVVTDNKELPDGNTSSTGKADFVMSSPHVARARLIIERVFGYIFNQFPIVKGPINFFQHVLVYHLLEFALGSLAVDLRAGRIRLVRRDD